MHYVLFFLLLNFLIKCDPCLPFFLVRACVCVCLPNFTAVGCVAAGCCYPAEVPARDGVYCASQGQFRDIRVLFCSVVVL